MFLYLECRDHRQWHAGRPSEHVSVQHAHAFSAESLVFSEIAYLKSSLKTTLDNSSVIEGCAQAPVIALSDVLSLDVAAALSLAQLRA